MNFKRFFSSLLMSLVVVIGYADYNYKVTSSSRLNVRKFSSTSAEIIGTLNPGQQIEVILINHGWAKIKYQNQIGYVSEKYIALIPKLIEPQKPIEKPSEEMTEMVSTYPNQSHSNSFPDLADWTGSDYEVDTPIVMGSSMSDDLNLYFSLQAGFGWSNFLWSNGDVNGTMAYSGNLLLQLYIEDKVSFFPRNWYSEIALGYEKLGAAEFDMNYVHASFCPLGFRIPLNTINIVFKAGVDLAYPLNNLQTNSQSWSADFQYGVIGGLQFEWRQFAIGCNVIYDFSDVSASCGQTLNNLGVLGTISYKFAKFGHK